MILTWNGKKIHRTAESDKNATASLLVDVFSCCWLGFSMPLLSVNGHGWNKSICNFICSDLCLRVQSSTTNWKWPELKWPFSKILAPLFAWQFHNKSLCLHHFLFHSGMRRSNAGRLKFWEINVEFWNVFESSSKAPPRKTTPRIRKNKISYATRTQNQSPISRKRKMLQRNERYCFT